MEYIKKTKKKNINNQYDWSYILTLKQVQRAFTLYTLGIPDQS